MSDTKTTVIHERFPYRYVQKGYIKLNGKPDLRLQKADEYTKKYTFEAVAILVKYPRARQNNEEQLYVFVITSIRPLE